MTYPLTTLYLGYAERIPFFHFFPGIRTVSVGTYGCNLNCSYCMNQHLLNEPAMFLDMSPEQVAAKSRAAGAGLISFSANEPAVSFSYFLDIAQAAREQDLLMGCSTNGLFTDAQLSDLSGHVSCVNISLKGPDSGFYHEVCRGGSFEQVVEAIQELHASGVHVEVTTPYITTMTRQDMLNIAQTISGISRQIPWHIFRLLPEYRCTDLPCTQIVDMIDLKNEAAGLLDFVYLENFPNSIWVDTLCPACGELVFKRVSTGGCGATLFSARIRDGGCPGCGAAVSFVGSVCMEGADQRQGDDPRKGVIEVGGWRSVVDMATCLPTSLEKPPILDTYISRNPYPGDMIPTSDTWVTDMALEAVREFSPDLLVATYSQCSFVARHREDRKLYREFVAIAHREIQRLITSTGYEYLVVGLGDMVPVKGTINLERHIRGIASADEGIAALFHPGPDDALAVSRLDGVSAVHPRGDIEEMLGWRLDPEICGEYFVVPREGWRFLAFSSSSRFSHRIDAMDATVPVYSSIAAPGHLREIRGVLADAVSSGRKLLLVILDGVGNRSFPFEGTSIGNTMVGIPYASSLHQYMVISTGEELCPHFFAYPHWKSSPRVNPFARHAPYLTDCITADVRRSGRTAVSVGNRSIITHTAFPADLTIECHCSALHHYGTLEVIP
jgi:pyruvate formate lyase activating enzyme